MTASGPRDSRRARLIATLAQLLRVDVASLAAVSVRVDDAGDGTAGGWQALTPASNERDASEIQQQYTDALQAWRKNPMAKRIVDTTTDYCLGDGMRPTAEGQLGNWLDRWWNHPKNNMDIRLPELCDELCRAGDLFITLHRNPDDGISYVRPIPKDRIIKIETLPNDWETETVFHQATDALETRLWPAAGSPAAATSDAVMIHYAVNRVVGALMGESDLGTMIPWLLRYSRMLEDRVRLHWATKLFMWLVTVPTNMVNAKTEQYRKPPEAGSIIVKDEGETWEPVTPSMNAFDARFDLQTVRGMIDAGSGFPPHWRGEATDVNLATATAMERSASRHLRRRQLYLQFLLQDLAHVAYSRAYAIGRVRPTPDRRRIQVASPDISRQDNRELAQAARDISHALRNLQDLLPASSPGLRRRAIQLLFRFAGEGLEPDELTELAEEAAGPQGAADADQVTDDEENTAPVPSSAPTAAGGPRRAGEGKRSPAPSRPHGGNHAPND